MIFKTRERWPGPLAEAGWLRSHLKDKNLRVLDVRSYFGQTIAGYPWGHIPGAFSANPDTFFTMGSADRHILPRDVLEPALSTLGLGRNVSIVVYDETTGPSAALAYWAFLAMGFGHVSVLNGGWQGWTQGGGPVEKDLPGFPEPAFSPAASGDHLLADTGYVIKALERGDAQFVDARTPAEFAAEHIPGAVSWPWTENILREREPEWLKPKSDLAHHAETLGLSPKREVICYCDTGAQAAHLCFVLRYLGFLRTRLYVGSWDAWSKSEAYAT